MIADGDKTIETRYWATSYRGPLLICSTKKSDIAPRGCAVAIVHLVDCRPMVKYDEHAACCGYDGDEIAWVLADVRKIVPFPVRGQRKLYDVALPVDVSLATQPRLLSPPGGVGAIASNRRHLFVDFSA